MCGRAALRSRPAPCWVTITWKYAHDAAHIQQHGTAAPSASTSKTAVMTIAFANVEDRLSLVSPSLTMPCDMRTTGFWTEEHVARRTERGLPKHWLDAVVQLEGSSVADICVVRKPVVRVDGILPRKRLELTTYDAADTCRIQ
jgi:hypothetical protein